MSAYTVKQVASLTGVPATTLRAWERRYGVVSPARTESRYRHYTDDEVARLRRMADLIADGTPASLAASQVGTRSNQSNLQGRKLMPASVRFGTKGRQAYDLSR